MLMERSMTGMHLKKLFFIVNQSFHRYRYGIAITHGKSDAVNEASLFFEGVMPASIMKAWTICLLICSS